VGGAIGFRERKERPFHFRYVIGLYVTLLSVVLLIGVAVDRYLSVIHTMKYHSIMRFKMAK